ncbi:hypothetical protein F4604DRAFT_1685709 [Suillus subluteus]|nr:hypothetical protein F4604DRAFT_1685709 [Suillus subluteus]
MNLNKLWFVLRLSVVELKKRLGERFCEFCGSVALGFWGFSAEEPKILMHSNECQDPTGCNEDWHAIWWNGMGRFLLDGRNPQLYDDAIKRFKELQFGCVSEGCKDLMFKILDQGAAFKHAEQFVSETCSFLVEKLVFEPEPPSP